MEVRFLFIRTILKVFENYTLVRQLRFSLFIFYHNLYCVEYSECLFFSFYLFILFLFFWI